MLHLLQLQGQVVGEGAVWVCRDVNQGATEGVVSVEKGWDGENMTVKVAEMLRLMCWMRRLVE